MSSKLSFSKSDRCFFFILNSRSDCFIKEAANYFRVLRRTIFRWSEVGKLPDYIIGNHRHRCHKRTDLGSAPHRVDITKEYGYI